MGLFVQTTRGMPLNGAEPIGERRVSQEKPKIAVATSAFNRVERGKHLENLLGVLEPLAGEIFVVTGMFSGKHGDNVHITRVTNHSPHDPLLVKAIKHRLLTQVKISCHLWRISSHVEQVLFYFGMLQYWMPMLAVKLRRKKVTLVATGSPAGNIRESYRPLWWGRVGGPLLYRLFRLVEVFNYSLADRIVVESESVIPFFGLERWRGKTSADGALPVDTGALRVEKPCSQRDNVVGYVGNLERLKGVTDFLEAMPFILKERSDVRFLIVGDGPLFGDIGRRLEEIGIRDRVELTGWILEAERLASYLNDMKLFVLPSATEGLPQVVLEAMACGTPVLATAVGGIPDLIRDGETGFILKEGTSQGIAEGVLRALSFPGLEVITNKARRLVEERYSQQEASRRFGGILLGEKK